MHGRALFRVVKPKGKKQSPPPLTGIKKTSCLRGVKKQCFGKCRWIYNFINISLTLINASLTDCTGMKD
jgi:hypothetical protein